MTDKNKHNEKNSTAAAAAGGFAAGAAGSLAANAIPKIHVEIVAEHEPETTAEPLPEEVKIVATAEAPEPEAAILANDEGIRFAHVDADNFGDAFAQARAQVGPGGAFEYNGKIYSTYIAEEWDAMSAEERTDYQHRVFQDAPAQHHTPSQHGNTAAHSTPSATTGEVPANAEMISDDPHNNPIEVIGVETVEDGNGEIMNVAVVEIEGEQALLVDIDNDGVIDAMFIDENHDGEYQPTEVSDISGAGIEIEDLMQSQSASQGDFLYAVNDDMPDYVNDADSIMSV